MASQIIAIRKPDYPDHHEAITEVRVRRPLGNTETISRVTCSTDIILNKEQYYVHVAPDTITVEGYSMNNNFYIRTRPDYTKRDNLLSLPRF